MPEEATLFTFRPGRWYAAEFIGDEFGADQELRSYSPIYIQEVIALKAGDGSIELAFHHENYPEGVQQKRYRLRVMVRESRYVVMQSTTHKPTRIVLAYELTWPWLSRHFGTEPRDGEQDPQRALGPR